MAQSGKLPSLGLGSGHDLRIVRQSGIGLALSGESAGDSLSALPPRACVCTQARSPFL